MAGLIVNIDPAGIVYDSPEMVREHIAFLAAEDPETLADLALGLLADLERERGNA